MLGRVTAQLRAAHADGSLSEAIRAFDRGEPDACAVGTAAFVAATEGGCGCPGGGNELGDAETGAEECGFEAGNVSVFDEWVCYCWDGVLPELRLG